MSAHYGLKWLVLCAIKENHAKRQKLPVLGIERVENMTNLVNNKMHADIQIQKF